MEHPAQSGRVSTSGWVRWLPGIATLRAMRRVGSPTTWQPSWSHDGSGASGSAYAVASGLPGSWPLRDHRAPAGLWLSAPAESWSEPTSALAAVILGVTAPLAMEMSIAPSRSAAMGCHCCAVCIVAGVARLGFVTELLEANPLRVHEWNRACGFAVRCPSWSASKSRRQGRCGHLVDRRGDRWWKDELDRIRAGGGHARGDLLDQDLQGSAGILAVASATAIVQVFDLETRAHVSVLGPSSSGLPAFSIPWVGVQDLTTGAVGGLAGARVVRRHQRAIALMLRGLASSSIRIRKSFRTRPQTSKPYFSSTSDQQ